MSLDTERSLLKAQGVYGHLGEIIKKVISQKPNDPHRLVEVLSRAIKQPPPAPEPLDVDALKSQADYCVKAQEANKVPTDESGPVAVCAIPNFMEEATMLEMAGVGFGEATSYKVMCSLRRLAASKPEVQKLRLWGKILGLEADYWVAEARKDGGGGEGDAEGGDDMEAPGQGANTCKYFVTSDLCEEWVELPDVKAGDIVQARMIKKIFTGRLDAKVITHPYFPGTEARLLRAQIARITADTTLSIAGFLKPDEEGEGAIQENPEFQAPPPNGLLKLENWSHMEPCILRTGRTTHREEPADAEDEETMALAKEIRAERDADPGRSLIATLDSDGLAWAVKQSGDTTLYGSTCSAVTYVRSLTWPGAVCAAKGNNFVNLYVGHALVAGEPDFFLCAPPDIMDEPEDPGDQPEPQGTDVVEEPKAEEAGG